MARKVDIVSLSSSTSYEESFDEEPSETNQDLSDENQSDEEEIKQQSFRSDINEEITSKTKESDDDKKISNNLYENSEYDYNNYNEYESEIDSDNSSNVKISSNRSSDINSDNYPFHLNFFRHPTNIPKLNEKKYKNGTRISLTFSNERMREIERHNHILLSKIISKTPSKDLHRNSDPTKLNQLLSRKSSATINREKQQRQIDYENFILKQKLEAIKKRRSH